ncbi:hypothetical protein ACJX0J_037691, partial [Zea mays]
FIFIFKNKLILHFSLENLEYNIQNNKENQTVLLNVWKLVYSFLNSIWIYIFDFHMTCITILFIARSFIHRASYSLRDFRKKKPEYIHHIIIKQVFHRNILMLRDK